MIHHIVALVATLSNTVLVNCRHGSTFVLAAFLLVEIATVPLNHQTWNEQQWHPKYGGRVSLWFWVLVPCWIASRLILPIWVMDLLFERIVLPLPTAGERWCLAPATACAFIICIFCQGVWWSMWVPEIINRAKRCRRVAQAIEEVRETINESDA
jgi:hypothetical protein